jgi:hypothetical protein
MDKTMFLFVRSPYLLYVAGHSLPATTRFLRAEVDFAAAPKDWIESILFAAVWAVIPWYEFGGWVL